MTHLLILGAGYVGQALAHHAIDELGWRVSATTRDPKALADLADAGVTLRRLDLFEDDPDEALADLVDPDTWVVYSAPTLWRELPETPGAPPRHVRPPMAVHDAAAAHGAAGLIYLSSTSVYGDHDGAWVDETTPLRPTSPMGKMRRDIEEALLATEALEAVYVARLVGIYGPGRTLAEYLERGRYKLVDGGQKVTNRVHRDDIVRAVVALVTQGPGGRRVYNVSDGDPRSVRELVEFITTHTDIPWPEETSLEQVRAERGDNVAARWKNTYLCDHDRLRHETDWQPRYPDVLSGYRAILDVGHDA